MKRKRTEPVQKSPEVWRSRVYLFVTDLISDITTKPTVPKRTFLQTAINIRLVTELFVTANNKGHTHHFKEKK